jgi:methionyl-tRNA formyltransferase
MIDVLFMGRKAVAADCLAWLIGRPDVRVVGVLTDNHLAVSPTSDVARAHGIPILDWHEARAAASRRTLSFDLGISVLFWRRIHEDLISIPKRGIINFHPAPLPEYKGTAGYNVAILEGRDTWATSAHYIDTSIDTGPIIEVRSFSIDPAHDTAQTLEAATRDVIHASFMHVVSDALRCDTLLPTTPNIGGRYISREEMEAMKRIHPGDDVARKVRAFFFPPYDGAYLEIDGTRYTLINREILQSLADPSASTLFTPESC